MSSTEEQIKKDVAVLGHRVKVLEEYPERVTNLEGQMVGVKQELHYVRQNQDEMKTLITTMKNSLDGIGHRVSRLFWTGAGVFLACSAVIGLAGVVMSIISSGILE